MTTTLSPDDQATLKAVATLDPSDLSPHAQGLRLDAAHLLGIHTAPRTLAQLPGAELIALQAGPAIFRAVKSPGGYESPMSDGTVLDDCVYCRGIWPVDDLLFDSMLGVSVCESCALAARSV